MTLCQAIELGEKHDPVLAACRSDLAAAHAKARESRSAVLPHLSANGFASDGSYSGIYSSSATVDPAYSVVTPATGFLDANLMLMLPLFTSGVLESQVLSATRLESAASADLREAEADSQVRIEDAYLKVLVANGNIIADKEWVAAATEMVRNSQAEFDAGKGIEAAVARGRAELASAQRSLTSAENDREKSLLDLKLAMGVSLDSIVTLSDALALSPSNLDLHALLAEAHGHRAAILAARSRLAAARADLRAALGASGPQLYGVAMTDAASQSASRGGSFGLTLSIPLFDGGQRQEAVARMRAAETRAGAQLETSQLTVDREVRQALLDVQTAEANARSADASVGAAEAAYGVSRLRFLNGKALLVEQLDALHTLTQAKADLLQATYEHEIGVARLRRAAGTLSASVGGLNS